MIRAEAWLTGVTMRPARPATGLVRIGTRDVLAVIAAARGLDLRLVGEAVYDSHVRLDHMTV